MDENNSPVSVTTGKKVPEGFKHTTALSDWVLRTTLGDNNIPTVKVEKSGYGLHLRGRDIEWPTYAKLEAEVDKPIEAAV